MELRLTLLDPRCVDSRVDVAIDAPSGIPFATVSHQLADVLGATAIAGWYFCCDREPVDDFQPLGLPPLLQGAVLTLASGSRPTATAQPDARLEAQVIAGPDAGTVVPLTVGRHTIGRGTGHPIRLTDPDVSRTHAELTVSEAGVVLRDAGSTNGTWRCERRLGSEPEPVPPESRIRIGTDLITVRRRDHPPAA